MLHQRIKRTTLSPSELALCQRVFDHVCSDEQLDQLGPDAEIVALTVLAIFQNVHTEERKLLDAVMSRRAEVRAQCTWAQSQSSATSPPL